MFKRLLRSILLGNSRTTDAPAAAKSAEILFRSVPRLAACALLGTVAAFVLAVLCLNAQTTFGSVVGNVTDPSGAAIGNTEVVLTNVGTNEKRTETTNADGLYQFVNVAPATYSVTVEKPGFKPTVR